MIALAKKSRLLLLIVGVVALYLLPNLVSLITGEPLMTGRPLYWQFQFSQIAILAVFALGYDLALGRAGMLSLGHGLLYGGGGYVFGILLKNSGIPFAAALLIGVAAAAFAGLVFGLLATRSAGIYFGMVTLAVTEGARNLTTSPRAQPLTGAEDGLRAVPLPMLISPSDNRLNLFYLSLTVLLLVLLLMHWFMSTPTGRVLVAIRENENRVLQLGYAVNGYKVLALTLSGLLAGLAGALSVVLFRGVAPETLAINQTAFALLAVIVGGLGTLSGPVLGVTAVVLLEDFLRTQLGGLWAFVYAGIGILVIALAPRGIVGALSDIKRLVMRRLQPAPEPAPERGEG
jgi:branched-chain amino acid transport system permease protein